MKYPAAENFTLRASNMRILVRMHPDSLLSDSRENSVIHNSVRIELCGRPLLEKFTFLEINVIVTTDGIRIPVAL